MGLPASEYLLRAIPLFPLPNVVLFPRAILPLHIFEERYKAMMADVVEGDGRVAMALLRPGWEKDYYGRPAIETLVCIGQVLTWEKLPDGKYNLLLQGRVRAKIAREKPHSPYRVADLMPLEEVPAMEIDLELERAALEGLFSDSILGGMALGRQFRELLGGPVSTPDIADLAAFNLLDDVCLKQDLLGEADVRRRVGRTIDALREFVTHINPALIGLPSDPGVN
jgi:hypothetical protein